MNLPCENGKEVLSLIPQRHICVQLIQRNGVRMELTLSIFGVLVIQVILVQGISIPKFIAQAKDNKREVGSTEEFAAGRGGGMQERDIFPIFVTDHARLCTVSDGDEWEMQIELERSLRLDLE